ncbi:MAG: hypothetical protein HFI57_03235 [Lachnospiraceae bacterium]|nr:hypothetical protein [Lachnospiraceae bacterium]
MIALKITNIKQFMGKLLGSETFDSFLLEEASISTYNTFFIDGHQNKDFYTTEEWDDQDIRPYDFSMWKTLRPLCFDLIKGTHTPTAFRFVLHLIPRHVESVLKSGETSIEARQVKAFVLNIKYDGTDLTIVTGTSYHTFLMDKTPDNLWDQTVRQFLSKKEIAYEEL